MYHWRQRDRGDLFENPNVQTHPVGPVSEETLYHHYNRRKYDLERQAQEEFNYFPESKMVPNFTRDVAAERQMYFNPNTAEGEAKAFESVYQNFPEYLENERQLLLNKLADNTEHLKKQRGAEILQDAQVRRDLKDDTPYNPTPPTWEQIGHGTLDALSMFDPTPTVDSAHAAWYAAKGDAKNAALYTGMAALPAFFGAGALGTKYFKKLNPFKKSFKSTINWAKWNPDIVKNKKLLDEYHTIEQVGKAKGTWMKNADGSPFKGTPEQWVQQQSHNFKKAFGESKLLNPDGSPMIVYHGSAKKFDQFDPKRFGEGDAGYSGVGIYTTPNKTKASSYTQSSRTNKDKFVPSIYELYGNTINPISSKRLIDNVGGDIYPFGMTLTDAHKIDKSLPLDLFNFNRTKGRIGPEFPIHFDAAIHNQQRGITDIRPLGDAYEIVFPNPTQVKSSVGNDGMFDMTNPNIYKQEGGDVDFEELEEKKQNPGWVANRLRKTVNPIGYNVKNAVKGFIKGKRQPFMWDGKEQTFETFGDNLDMSKDQAQHIKSSSMDAWLKYLGFPQENETFVKSDFKPTIRKEDKEGTQNYWSFSNDDDVWNAASKHLDSKEPVLIKDSEAGGFTMKNFTVENKYDPNTKLDYISYYDEFDFDIPTGIGNIKGERIAGEPYEIYGRMYYDKKYKDEDGNPRRIPNEVVDRYSIRLNDMKAGIQRVESLDGKLMKNPQSSATGRYGQLFNQIRKQYKGNRNSFAKDGDAQNKFFEKKFNGTLFKNEKGMQQTGYELYWEYQEVADKHGYTPVDIAALSNMLGRKGTREYLGYHLRDGKPLEEALPRIYGKRKRQQNKTPDEYIRIFREGVDDYRKIQTENLNSVLESLSLDMEKNPEFKELFMKKFDIPLEEKGGEVLKVDKKNNRLRQQLLEYRKGNKISKVAMDELMSMGLI